ncbi:proton-coupled amino acid transporter-like protein pathetic isoform X1 [Anopheles albimanus]|uniref:proton-coupled amino acid transporter-like protein pathetic isoform X1 n=1 Tax=Anopheles albimanus TaxID=7167 RepID=UPI00163F3A06|nr:proton-coupled amino acid transporter-like protein pathetic isoform X1 [Anopheles albimanus]
MFNLQTYSSSRMTLTRVLKDDDGPLGSSCFAALSGLCSRDQGNETPATTTTASNTDAARSAAKVPLPVPNDGRYHIHHHHLRERPEHDYTLDVITVQGVQPHHKTSYLETLMHLFKGNIGTGCYAMGDAFRNGGLLLATTLTLFLGFVCVHCQHVLLNCANLMQQRRERERDELGNGHGKALADGQPLDFADTVGCCFQYGPVPFRRWAATMRHIVNVFICVTQLGFCCIYFVFISSNYKQIGDRYGLELTTHHYMALLLVPIILTSIITQLKFLSYCSMIANVFMTFGIGITFYYALKDLPAMAGELATRGLVGETERIPLFFGTAIFAFEGIALVLPLQNEMRRPADFGRTFGVLNVGMVFIVTLFTVFGFVGYLRWGEEVQGSMTLNLPDNEALAEGVKMMIATGVLLGFALQFFVAIMILWPMVESRSATARHYPVLCEMIFRILLVLMTFLIAKFVPSLGLFISLIGAFCSSALALMFPPIIELIVAYSTPGERPTAWLLAKNVCILLLAVLGFATGTYESFSKIIQAF